MARNALAVMAVSTLLCACAGNNGRPTKRQIEQIDRILVTAPGAAQPSTIVKTELAYKRTARQDGIYEAALVYAQENALFHGRNGPAAALSVFEGLNDPGLVSDWSPKTVVMSCDGALAVAMGRYVDPEGIVGNYITTWERQGDSSYKWSYDVAAPDNPQPPPREEFEDGDIVVTGIDAVQGLVASCPRGQEVVPAPPALAEGPAVSSATQISRDRTLRWQWQHRGDGSKYIRVDYYFEGEWVTAIEESLASLDE